MAILSVEVKKAVAQMMDSNSQNAMQLYSIMQSGLGCDGFKALEADKFKQGWR